jgi:endoglucanase
MVVLLGSGTLTAIRRTEMNFGMCLSNWVVMLVFLLGLLSNANAQAINSSTEDFETGDFSKFPWRSSGDTNWTIASYEKNSGSYSAQAGTIDHDETTTLRVTLDCPSGAITFYRKVSSESNYDLLEFYIDGVEKDSWSGEEDWAEVSFHVNGGRRTFEWTYSKDGSSSEGDDTAWIDDIVFPAGGATKPTGIPFKRGLNLTNWFQYISGIRQIQFTKFTKQDLINIKSLGCDVIRLPIDLLIMTNGEPDYTIDPLFYYFLDQVIDWAEELELHLILDNHTGGPQSDTDPDIGNFLIPVWTQMAEHYKERTNYIYYEILNEPHGISDTTWNEIQLRVINAIRAVDQKHTIIVGPAGWNSYNNLRYMPRYRDDNLIYTFHFYDPFLFTHQGASWNTPSLVPLAGVPFPYDYTRMPDCPAELEGTWVKDGLANYRNEGTVEHVRELIDIAVDFKTARNVPLFCGEFGVLMHNCNDQDRVYWYNVVRNYLERKGIAWTTWDYKGGFGLFEQGTDELFDYDLNIPLVEALGLNAPPQQEFIPMPDVSEFDIYLDHIAPNIIESSWMGEGLLDYYSENNPASGDFCIHWTGVNQYNNITFRFSPVKDLSVLVNESFAIDFWVRCNSPNAKIDIRFIDTKTGDRTDHPWRMRYTIDRNVAVWDGRWNHLQIPLNEFSEHGSWDNGRWLNPIGKYDWTATERFEIVSEFHDFIGINIYFDDIRVVDTKSLSE